MDAPPPIRQKWPRSKPRPADARPFGRLIQAAPRACILTGLILALALAGQVALHELAAARLQSAAQALGRGVDQSESTVTRWLALCGRRCPAQADEGAAAAYAELAAAFPARRERLLAQAEQTANLGLRRNPLSAEGWARLGMIRAARAGGRATPGVLRALRQSYAAAPYHRGAAQWRVSFCAAHWDEVTPQLRLAALAELAWLDTIDNGAAFAVRGRIEDPFVRELFEIRLLARRQPR